MTLQRRSSTWDDECRRRRGRLRRGRRGRRVRGRHRRRRDVLVLDRAGAAGGAAAMSDGFIYLGGGTPTQQRGGLPTDTVENMTRVPAAPPAARPGRGQDRRSTATRSARAPRLAGGPRRPSSSARCSRTPTAPPPVDGEGLLFTGGENAWPFDESRHRRRAGTSSQGERPGGAVLMRLLSRGRASQPAPAPSTTPGPSALVVDDGPVVRAWSRSQYGADVAIRARTGVVLAAGGFINNPEMVEHYAPAVHATPLRLGTDGDDGRGIRMAQAVGAQLKRMDAIECALPFNAPRSLVHGILVNRFGPALRQRGHLPGPGRADRAAAPRGPGVPDRRRGALRAELADDHAPPGCARPQPNSRGDRAAARIAHRDARLLQRARRARRGSAVPQATAGADAAARPARGLRPAGRQVLLRAVHARRPAHRLPDGAVLDLARRADPRPVRGRAHDLGRRRARATRAGCRSATRPSSAGSPAARRQEANDASWIGSALDGQVAVVTGAGRGIGAASARRARRGGRRRRHLGAHRGAAAARSPRRSRRSAARRTSSSPT